MNPVTEQEMREMFERIATTFVNLSAQASELVEIKVQIADLQSRLTTAEQHNRDLEETNAYLNTELSTARQNAEAHKAEANTHFQLAAEFEQKADQHKAEADRAKAELEALRGYIVARDAKVQELTADLEAVTSDNQHLTSTLGEERADHYATTQALNDVRVELQTVIYDRDDAINSRNAAFAERDQYKTQVDAIQEQVDLILGRPTTTPALSVVG